MGVKKRGSGEWRVTSGEIRRKDLTQSTQRTQRAQRGKRGRRDKRGKRRAGLKPSTYKIGPTKSGLQNPDDESRGNPEGWAKAQHLQNRPYKIGPAKSSVDAGL